MVEITVRPLGPGEVDAADRVSRRAFHAQLGTSGPIGAEPVAARALAGHTAVLGAFGPVGVLLGSVVVSRWGREGVLGPLSVDPPHWRRGVGSRLTAAALAVLDGWGVRRSSLFTFADSPGHHVLYQRFGFWPRFLAVTMSVPVTDRLVSPGGPPLGWRAGDGAPEERAALLAACARLTDALAPGLDVGGEIETVLEQKIGDVVLVGEPDAPSGFAVCHRGPGSEAARDTVLVKFAAVTGGQQADDTLVALLAACRDYAGEQDAGRLVAGVGTARRRAYRTLLAGGFRVESCGVTMHRPDEPGFDQPDAMVLTDLR